MNDIIYKDKNKYRGSKKVEQDLKLLERAGLIKIVEINTDCKVYTIKWNNLFPEKSDGNWIKFMYNDFDIFNIVGVNFYCVMWLMRMYTNYKTKTSFIPIEDMAKLIKCKTIEVQRAVDFFEYVGLFTVQRGAYHKPEGVDRAIKCNNSYKYTSDIEYILTLKNTQQQL